MQPPEAPQPFVVIVVPETPAPETTVADVVLGSLGVAGTLLVIALCLGVVMAAIRLGWHSRHPPADDHLPPVTPFTIDSRVPPSSQAR